MAAADLFDGMVVLLDPSSSSPTATATATTTTASAGEDHPPPPLPPSADPLVPTSQSQPLDENLFSDLTITAPDAPLPTPPPSFTPAAASSARTTARKKKRGGVRIGYARNSSGRFPPHFELCASASDGGFRDLDEDGGSSAVDGSKKELGSPPPSPTRARAQERMDAATQDGEIDGADENGTNHQSIARNEVKIDEVNGPNKELDPSPLHARTLEREDSGVQNGEVVDGDETNGEIVDGDETGTNDQQMMPQSCEEEEPKKEQPVSVEEKLALIRESMSKKREEIMEIAASVLIARKEAARKRRKATENVNLAATEHRELERELEEACEAEDFERAERVSERLLEVEQGKLEFVNAQRDAEAECDSIDVEMLRVLEMQIAAEEESASILKMFAKDSADNADMVARNVKELSSKEIEEWMVSTEALESRRMELDIESFFIRDAEGRMNESIDASVEDDRTENEILTKRREILTEELEKLLVLVRLKEAEIAENDSKIEEVEKRIANVVSGCQEAQSIIDKNHEYLQSELSQIELENEALLMKKKRADEFFSMEEKKKLKLEELASTAAAEAKALLKFAQLRKSLAASILTIREEKLRLAKSVEKMTEEVQIIKQNVSVARTSLQELSVNRASIQQEIASAKQRINFIDKRGPEVEIEKKVASAARNFKEAARIASEAKALSIEKESIQNKLQIATSELEKVENAIEHTVDQIQKDEELISSKEKEAALSRLQMLRLLSTAARAEECAALELDDVAEAALLHAEAEAVESEAAKLQEAYAFEDSLEETGKASKHIPIALIVNLAGEKLIEIAGSANFIR